MGWTQTVILLISAFRIARITGVGHCELIWFFSDLISYFSSAGIHLPNYPTGSQTQPTFPCTQVHIIFLSKASISAPHLNVPTYYFITHLKPHHLVSYLWTLLTAFSQPISGAESVQQCGYFSYYAQGVAIR
jgi:hypothetical protein